MHVPKALVQKQWDHRKIQASYKLVTVYFCVINGTAVLHTAYFLHVMKSYFLGAV
jgi:hypothetical protein